MVSEDLSEVLSEFARTMLTDFPIQGILDHLVRRIVDVLPVTAAGVTLISPGTDPRYVAASNRAALGFEKLQTELDEGPCVAAYNAGEPISIPDLRLEERFPRFAPRALDAGMVAVFTFPLRHGDSRPLGALDLYRDAPGQLSEEAMHASQTLADVAAAYLLNAQGRADLQAASDRSRDAALHDALTGLPNRTLLLERIQHASQRGKRSHRSTALLFVDLDRFKEVNDTYGHQVGDEALVALAERLPRVLRPGDTLARISGDEFVVLCEDLAEGPAADAIVARLTDAFTEPFVLSETEVRLDASIGLAFTTDGAINPEELLREADLAMYEIKRGDRNRPGGLHHEELHRADFPVDLEHDLHGATDRGELFLDYQPIVSTADGQIVGVEALVRWNHPNRGLIPPALLVPLAERSRLIVEIGHWVLEQSLADRRRWQSAQAQRLNLAVNVSAVQLLSAGFAKSVASAVEADADGPGLTLEITESVLVTEPSRALRVLRELRGLGVKLALDDFGTGYSSLSFLNQYPVDYLKVDREFTATLDNNPASGAIITAVLGLAHELDIEVVAEGVETADQRRRLTDLACDRCQGFYFARPMPSTRLDELIQRCDDDLHLPVAFEEPSAPARVV